MNLEIVDYETAVDLKKVGFDWKTDYLYNRGKSLHISGMSNKNLEDDCAAPTQAEVCKWFRDVHDINITPDPYYSGLTDKKVYGLWIINKNGWKRHIDEELKTYEQAELIGIKKVIEILKERQL